MYKEANEAAEKGPKTALKNRILLHVSHKVGEIQPLRIMSLHLLVHSQLAFSA